MRFLHTSDWHLGQKLLNYDRHEEHHLALDWLIQTIKAEEVEVLIVAGDIFDIGNPPNYARSMYYRFLTQLIGTTCRYIVITGGNHDSPAMLNAPRELLQALNVHVVGAVPEDLKDELVALRQEDGTLEAVVAAVPFLRDRDLQYSVAGIGGLERIERIKEGIVRHYAAMGELATAFAKQHVPILATGHLYATGAEASEKQDNIYIGNKENIKANQFPEVFSYVALGHIHRMQMIGGQQHIRYSGSLIPLSFSETKDEKQVLLVDYEGAKCTAIQAVPVPTFRRLKTVRGDLQTIKERLRAFAARDERLLTPWVEVLLETDEVQAGIDLELRDWTQEMDLELLKIRIIRTERALDTQTEILDLEEMEILDVFKKKCESYGVPDDQLEELEHTFLDLQNWMNERE